MRWPWRRRRRPVEVELQRFGAFADLLEFPHSLKDESMLVAAADGPPTEIAVGAAEWWERHAADQRGQTPAPTLQAARVKYFDGQPGWAMLQGWWAGGDHQHVHLLVPLETLPQELRAQWLPDERRWEPRPDWSESPRGRSGRRIFQAPRPVTADREA